MRRRIGRAAGFFAIAALGLLSTGFHCGEAAQVKLGEAFELRAGEKVSVGGEVEVRFVAVPQDSRCPKGEQCITAGKAVVRLEVTPRDGKPVTIDLETGARSESGESDASGFRIVLLDLSPYPSVSPPNNFPRLPLQTVRCIGYKPPIRDRVVLGLFLFEKEVSECEN